MPKRKDVPQELENLSEQELEARINAEAEKIEEPPKEVAEEPPPQEVEKEPKEPVQDNTAPSSAEPTPEPTNEAQEWVKKKGWKAPEDAAKSFRELERAFHEKSQENKRLREQQAYQPPANAYQPSYQPYGFPQPPAYPPPPQQQYYGPPTTNEEEIAMSYGLPVEDFRKVLRVAKDVSEINARSLHAQYQKELEEIRNRTESGNDLNNVIGDPAFHLPEVQKEMHEIFEKEPETFNRRNKYSYALDKALTNLARKNLIRGTNGTNVSPPKTAGSGTTSGSEQGRRNLRAFTQQDFSKMSIAEQEKYLKSQGAFKTHFD